MPSARTVPLIVLCGVQLVDVLGVTSAIAALPAIARDLDARQWTPVLASAYAALFGGLLVLGARLGDRYGQRRVLLCGVLAFTAAGLLGGLSQDVVQVVAARALQGAAAALGVPCALRLLLALPARGSERSALAAWSATGAAAGALGFVVGGALVDASGWRAVLLLAVPVGFVLAAGVAVAVAPLRGDRAVRLDVAGAGLLVIAVTANTVGASLLEAPTSRTRGALLLVAGVGAGAVLAAQQRRARTALVPRGVVRSPALRTGVLVSFVNTAATSSAGVLAALLLQQRLRLPASTSGLLLLPFSAAVVAGAALSGLIGRGLGARRLAATGLLAIGAGDLLLAATAGSAAAVVAGTAVAGFGLGLASVAANEIGTSVPEDLRGAAVGLLNTAAQIGTALGVAALLVLADLVGEQGTAVSWTTAGAVAIAVGVLVLTGRGRIGVGRAT